MLNTLFRKLVVVLLLFGLLMSMISLKIVRYSHEIYHHEIQQKFHIDIAKHFASLAGWTSSGWRDPAAATAAFSLLVTINPQFQIFTLDRDGLVLAHYPNMVRLASNRVSLLPIKRMLQPHPQLPILGDDPANSNVKEVFSVAQLKQSNRLEQYLYVTLHSEEDEESAAGLRLAYITRDGAWLSLTSLVLALTGGLLSLHFVVRPLKQLASTMDAFRAHQVTDDDLVPQQLPISGDEIDVLTGTFYRMAALIQQQIQEIEKTDTIRREFITNVSHDLRTPIASIQGYLETLSLKNASLTVQERHQYLQIALNQAQTLSQLISTLFYLARLDSGQIDLQPEAFRIDELMQDVVQKFALQAQHKNIRLGTEAYDKAPFVCADLGLIERALSNLIDNALSHTPEGGAIQLQLNYVEKKVWVAVVDSGNGIAESDMPYIFDRFYRGNSARVQASANAGLGLSIVRRIFDMHGEIVEAVNVPGGGALFRFSLPSMQSGDGPCGRPQFFT